MTYLFKSNWHMPNFITKKSTKRRALKTINIISTLAIILNTGLVTAFINPTAASAADTGYKSPLSTNNPNDWTNPNNAFSSNNSYATGKDDSATNEQGYDTFGFGVPAGSTINGIEVKVEAKSSDTSGCRLEVDLSKDGGANWGNDADTSSLTGSDVVYTLGGASDLWGTTWSATSVDDFNFSARLRIDDTTGNDCDDAATISIDHVQAIVHYTAAPVRPTPAANPAFGQTCGLDVALVIDSSGSIDNTELGQMKTAYKSFVDAFLPGTPSQFSVTEFDEVATVTQTFSSNAATVKTAVDAAVSGGFTNWDDGLAKAWSTFDPRPAKPNLVLFASDGNPNRKSNPAVTVSEADAVDAAILQANIIKNAGTRVVALGIGSDLDVANLQAVSGPNVAANAAQISATSDVITGDFATLGTTLSALAKQLCGGKILVQKTFDTNGDGVADLTGNVPDAQLAGWNFDVNGSPTNPAAQNTTNTGALEFTVENGTYSVVETSLKANTGLVSASCKLNNQTVGTFDAATRTVNGLVMGTDQTISCTFLNQAKTCNLEIVKSVNKQSALPGDTLTYTLHYKNTGNGECTGGGVRVDDTVPAGVTYNGTHTQTAGTDYGYQYAKFGNGQTNINPPAGAALISWNANVLSPAEEGEVTWQATVNAVAPCTEKDITNVGKLYADQNVNGITSNQVNTHISTPCEGSIKVNKKVDVNGTGTFTLDNPSTHGFKWGLDAGAVNRDMGTTATGQSIGSHSVTENSVANYHFVGWYPTGSTQYSCSNPQGTTLPISVNVVASQTTEITLCNARDTGRITFDKVVVGGTAKDGDFTFTVNNQNYKDGDAASFLTGSYALTEGAVTGYTLTGASGACSLGQNGVTLSVTTQGGTCTITNTRDTGTLIVHKDVLNPDGGAVADTHNFSVLLNAGNQKTIAEGTDATYSNLDTGTYTIVENADGDYTFVSYSADGDANVAGAQVTVTKGQTTHLTVTNKQKKATITISKDVRDYNGNDIADTTAFTVQWTGGANGSIAEGNNWVMQVNPGSYTFTELTGSNYTTTSTNPKQLTVGSNGQASYTFVNKQKSSSISGKKFEDDNANGVKNSGEDYRDGWEIYLDLNNSGTWNAGEPKVTTGNGSWSDGYYEFTNLIPGTYTVREVGQSGWVQIAPAGSHTVNLAVNQAVTDKNFANFKLGKIWGYKYEDKDGDGNVDQSDLKKDGWTICLNGQTCVVTGAGNWSDGYYEFTGLTAGNYTVTEQLATGWYAVAPQLTGYNVSIESGDSIQKNFFNFKGFDLTVKKLIDGDASLQTAGDQSLATSPWTIEVWKNGVKIDTQQTVNGSYTWTNLPYGEYEVKEIFNSNEWQALLSDNITVPNWSDDNSSKTIGEFDAVSGTNVEVTFINWKRAPVKIVASKIVCREESSLPNWGANGGPNVTAATAQNFVSQSEGECWFASDWTFQWGWDGIANPGDNTGENGNWFSFGPTGIDGSVAVEIPTLQNSKVWLREAWSQFYIPFTYGDTGNQNNVSAEFYCNTDVLNYDNYEWIDGLKLGENGNQPTYYCVAWNVPNTFDVNIDKVVNMEGETVEAGTNLSYTLNWTLTGNTPTEVKLMDPLPANTTFVSADNGGFLDGNTVRWNLGTFNPAANGSVNVTVKVNSPLDNGTVITNTGTVCGLGYILEGEPFASNREDVRRQKCDDDTTTTTVSSRPTLGLEKTASPATVGGNQDVTYTVIWSVAGNSKATNVVVTDPIPANTSYVSMGCGTTTGTCTTSTTGTPVTSTTWNLGTRNPGEGGTLTLVVKTAVSVPNNSVIPNIANIKSAEVDPVFAQADVKAATAPVLQITKTSSATIVNPGDPISYTVKVKNIGTDTAVNAVATDTLPAGFSFVSTSPVANSIVGQTATWNLGNMIVGQEVTLTYTVNVAPGTTAGVYDNIAKAKADNAPEVSTKVPVTTRIPQVLGEATNPVLEISKSVSKKSVAPGAVVSYTVKVKNSGTGSAINVELQDILPIGFAFDGTNSTSNVWNLGDIAVGETKTVTYKVKVGSSVPNGSYENLAIASADNHGKVTATAPVQVKRGRVLAEVIDTGAGMVDFVIAASGLGLIILGYVLTRRKSGTITA